MQERNLSRIDLNALHDVSILLLEANYRTRTRWMKECMRGKSNVRAVTNERSYPLYEHMDSVSCTFHRENYTNLEQNRGSLFVFDDCFPNGAWMQEGILATLISYPRTLGITSVFGFHHLYGIPPRIRWELDIVCIGSNPSNVVRERIYETFFQDVCSMEDLCGFMDRYTQDRGLLVLRCDVFGSLEERVFYARMP